MNKKGFTLIEILVVVVLLGVVIGLVVPRMTRVNTSIAKRNFETKKELIVSAAEMYVQEQYNGAQGDSYCVSVEDLIENNYLEVDLKENINGCNSEYGYGCVTSPVDNSILNGKKIRIEENNGRYTGIWDNNECEQIAAKLDTYKENFVITNETKEIERQGLKLINQFQYKLFVKYLMETIEYGNKNSRGAACALQRW